MGFTASPKAPLLTLVCIMSQESSALTMTKEKSPFFNDKWFFANANGQPFYPSTLEEGTTVAVIFYRFHDKEELLELGNLLDELHITSRKLKVVSVGRSVTALPRELAGRHRICSCDNHEALVFFGKKLRTIESFDEKTVYLMIVSEVVISDKSKDFSPWRSITNSSLKDFKMALPTTEYFCLKELIDTQPSNVGLLRALLLTEETNFLIKGNNQVGIETLEGKFIFLLISWLDKFKDEKKTFQTMSQNLEKLLPKRPTENSTSFEVVWIPIVSHGRGTPTLLAELVQENTRQEISWLAVANPWSINPSAKQILRMHCRLDKLPLFIAKSPQGQIRFENFFPLAEDTGIEALSNYVMSLSNSK